MMRTRNRILLLGLGVLLGLCPLAAGQRPAVRWRPAPVFAERWAHDMCYDPIRQRIVLYGGALWGKNDVQVFYGDTWTWSGKRWDKQHPKHSPAKRSSHRMAFDPVSRRVLLFGGFGEDRKAMGDTWAWDGKDWQKLNPTRSPPARGAFAMSWNPARGKVVLFGGTQSFYFGGAAMVDTWEWDGGNWNVRSPKVSPPARVGGDMEYLPKSRSVFLYGGGTGGFGSLSPSTWEWDGTNWIKHVTTVHPPMIGSGAMALRPDNGRILLVNYQTAGPWEWDGKAWTMLKVTANLPRRQIEAGLMAMDPASKRLIFTGQYLGRADKRTTWAFDGKTWAKVDDRPFPYKLATFAAAHDEKRDVDVIIAPADASRIHLGKLETWEFSNGDFRRITTVNAPPSRARPYLVYDASRGGCVLFSGSGIKPGQRQVSQLRDTWFFDGKTWTPITSKLAPPDVFGLGLLVHDIARKRGFFVSDSFPLETWELGPGGWTRLHPTSSPPSGGNYAMAYDPMRRIAVLFGGSKGFTKLTDTWIWDGSTWSKAPAAPKTLEARTWPKLAYHAGLGGIVLLGGAVNTSSAWKTFGDTWFFDGKTWSKVATNSLPTVKFTSLMAVTSDTSRQTVRAYYMLYEWYRPADGVWELSLDTLQADLQHPRPGDSFVLSAQLPSQSKNLLLLGLSTSDRPGIPVRVAPGGVQLWPLAPDWLLDLSLSGRPLVALDAAGKGSLRVTVPNLSVLAWFRFHAAGLTFDSQGVSAITNAIPFQIVR